MAAPVPAARTRQAHGFFDMRAKIEQLARTTSPVLYVLQVSYVVNKLGDATDADKITARGVIVGETCTALEVEGLAYVRLTPTGQKFYFKTEHSTDADEALAVKQVISRLNARWRELELNVEDDTLAGCSANMNFFLSRPLLYVNADLGQVGESDDEDGKDASFDL